MQLSIEETPFEQWRSRVNVVLGEVCKSPEALRLIQSDYPRIIAPVQKTPRGTSFLQAPGVVLLSRPATNLRGLDPVLAALDPEFSSYELTPTHGPSDGERLAKFAGQLCYLSLGPGHTPANQYVRYFQNIKEHRHGSVLEHVNYSCLFYGIDRSVTHELVRHRAGFAYSQVSQRYVSGKHLRFVCRPEFATGHLFDRFCELIDSAAHRYEHIAEELQRAQKDGSALLSGERASDLRKKVNQSARAVLPNCTEAPIVVTANVRAWRHFFEQRASQFADVQIRELAFRTFLCLSRIDPSFWGDIDPVVLSDGTHALSVKHVKI